MEKNITIYTTTSCPYCHAAKDLLQQKDLAFTEIDVTSWEERKKLVARTGWKTVPQIFIGEELIGGYQELAALERSGELAKRLS